ncbi:gp38.4 [Caviid betaherpesvirus 2]|uniref:Gp38.4 n=1 Tax=Guinea pig cytomegalovirus (strain 22122) TaxID=103920 RepID=B7TPW1_GPCMV|nr:gp38.4 [Caviid betaherpesvirus 2]AGE11519.1 gp38.4 [Caviid betaherpesvirus 2]AIL83907.1 gp38.4 [BAC cloning vector GPN13BACdenovo_preserved(MM)]BAJ78509.1 gp38.4 [Caviid betaherpesvirus 2]
MDGAIESYELDVLGYVSGDPEGRQPYAEPPPYFETVLESHLDPPPDYFEVCHDASDAVSLYRYDSRVILRQSVCDDDEDRSARNGVKHCVCCAISVLMLILLLVAFGTLMKSSLSIVRGEN